MNKIWFKRKRYGYGWYPATWEGWVVLLAYILVALLLATSLDEDATLREILIMFFLPLAILTAGLIRICYRMGEK